MPRLACCPLAVCSLPLIGLPSKQRAAFAPPGLGVGLVGCLPSHGPRLGRELQRASLLAEQLQLQAPALALQRRCSSSAAAGRLAAPPARARAVPDRVAALLAGTQSAPKALSLAQERAQKKIPKGKSKVQNLNPKKLSQSAMKENEIRAIESRRERIITSS